MHHSTLKLHPSTVVSANEQHSTESKCGKAETAHNDKVKN